MYSPNISVYPIFSNNARTRFRGVCTPNPIRAPPLIVYGVLCIASAYYFVLIALITCSNNSSGTFVKETFDLVSVSIFPLISCIWRFDH